MVVKNARYFILRFLTEQQFNFKLYCLCLFCEVVLSFSDKGLDNVEVNEDIEEADDALCGNNENHSANHSPSNNEGTETERFTQNRDLENEPKVHAKDDGEPVDEDTGNHAVIKGKKNPNNTKTSFRYTCTSKNHIHTYGIYGAILDLFWDICRQNLYLLFLKKKQSGFNQTWQTLQVKCSYVYC